MPKFTFVPRSLRRVLLALVWAPRLARIYQASTRAIFSTIVRTGETSNFTYDLTPQSLRQMAEAVSVASRLHVAEVEAFIQEAIQDAALNGHLAAALKGARTNAPAGLKSQFGRRLGWYAMARAIKPRLIVETGVDRGHGSLILCAALLRNRAEGVPGRYAGTDIDPMAGRLLSGAYSGVGEILYGDSIASLEALEGPIDLFINDSDHSSDYELREYRVVRSKLSPQAVILGDNAHASDSLAAFSREADRQFLFFREAPLDHWYPGAGIGISFV